MLPRELVESWIRDALEQVPETVRRNIKNVAFILEDRPRIPLAGDVPIQRGGILLGLYRGVPLPIRGRNYTMVPPDTITLFQAAIEQVSGPDPKNIQQQIRQTVWHEIAHYLGMNEAEVRAWERRQRQRRAKP